MRVVTFGEIPLRVTSTGPAWQRQRNWLAAMVPAGYSDEEDPV